MANFQIFRKHLGTVKRGNSYTVVFAKTEDCKSITRIDVGCGCQTTGQTEQEVTVHWSVSATETLGTVVKHVFVNYEDSTQDVLSIEAQTE